MIVGRTKHTYTLNESTTLTHMHSSNTASLIKMYISMA